MKRDHSRLGWLLGFARALSLGLEGLPKPRPENSRREAVDRIPSNTAVNPARIAPCGVGVS